jgi:hypothetical protein
MFAAQLLSEPAAGSARTGHWSDDAKRALTQHWPEYMIEGFCLGMFMISVCTFAAVLEHSGIAGADERPCLPASIWNTVAFHRSDWKAAPVTALMVRPCEDGRFSIKRSITCLVCSS